MMIEMGDREGKGGVNREDFIVLMKELGLIPKEKKKRERMILEPGMNPNDPFGNRSGSSSPPPMDNSPRSPR